MFQPIRGKPRSESRLWLTDHKREPRCRSLRPTLRAFAGGCLVAVALALAGCGGDEFDKDPPADDLDAYLAFKEEGAELYEQIGASDCADGIREANEAIKEAHNNVGALPEPDPGA